MNKLIIIIVVLLLGLNASFVWKSWKKETAGALCSIPAKLKMESVNNAPIFLPGAMSLLK